MKTDAITKIVNKLDGIEYDKIQHMYSNSEIFQFAKENGIVIVFGASDDLVEFRGAIDNEAYGPGKVYFTKEDLYEPECLDADCPHEERLRESLPFIDAISDSDISEYTWAYKTSFDSKDIISNFEVIDTCDEKIEKYCLGLVFALKDVFNL